MGSIKEYVKSSEKLSSLFFRLSRLRHIKLIVDTPLGFFKKPLPGKKIVYATDIDRDSLARETILSVKGEKLNFLDFGGGDGKLKHVLGNVKNEFFLPRYNENKIRFEQKYNYYGVDLDKKADKIITGDVCDAEYMNKNKEFAEFFDVIYSNNVFEHLNKPWIAIENIYRMLKPGGICIIIAPFAWRYHEVPEDYFRYSHTAFPFLFNCVGKVEVIKSGYDITQRRDSNQGDGVFNDICPTDRFGAWKESWHTVTVVRKV